MKELDIFDKVENQNYIISIGNLIKALEKIDGDFFNGQWEILQGAYGYGELVCSIEDELEKGNKYLIDGRTIFPILKTGNQYFYNACLKKVDSEIELGMFDSTFLFLRSNDEQLLKKVSKAFGKIRIISC